MKVVGLISGGKDSTYNMLLCQKHGHEIVALANLHPQDPQTNELDSYMFQTAAHQLILHYSTCTSLPLYRRALSPNSSIQQSLGYSPTDHDEVEDLYLLLKQVIEKQPDVQAVSCGAIASDYQRLRVENVCQRLGLISLAYMWHQSQQQLLRGMIEMRVEAVLVKVAALGLEPQICLGKTIGEMEQKLLQLREKYGINLCGEGGEYETITLNCPLFKFGRIVMDEWKIDIQGGSVSPCGWLIPVKSRVDYIESNLNYNNSNCSISSNSSQNQQNAEQLNDRQMEDVNVNVVFNKSQSGQVFVDGKIQQLQSYLKGSVCLQQTMHQIIEKLQTVQMSLDDALFVRLYVRDMNEFEEINKAYIQFFPTVNPPARACVQLPLDPQSPVQIQILLQQQFGLKKLAIKNVLHVQSISAWAPSCIGPYSQSVQYDGIIRMAGQIPLDPGSMKLIQGDLRSQFTRCMLSCEKVATAMSSDVRSFLLSANIYCVNKEFVSVLKSYMFAYLRLQQKNGECNNYQDEYLKRIIKQRTWEPLVTFFVVPALPKGALVEIQIDLLDGKSSLVLETDSDEEVESSPMNFANGAKCQIGAEIEQIIPSDGVSDGVCSFSFDLHLNDLGSFCKVANGYVQTSMQLEIVAQYGKFFRCSVGFLKSSNLGKKQFDLVINLLKYIAQSKFNLVSSEFVGCSVYYEEGLCCIEDLQLVEGIHPLPFNQLGLLRSSEDYQVLVEVLFGRHENQ